MAMLHFLDDENLSWEAKGMLAFYLRDKTSVEVTIGEIFNESPDGRKKTERITKELKEKGYRQTDRYQDDSGIWHWETWLYAYKQESVITQ